MENTPPQMAPYGRHLLMCKGQFCDPQGKAQELYESLSGLLGDLGRYTNPRRVKRGLTDCLGVCAGGPLLVVYPEGIWYHHVDEALLKRIIDEHLRRGCPVREAIFHRLAHEDPDNCAS